MSFDTAFVETNTFRNIVSIPFEQGDVFRPKSLDYAYHWHRVSIPFEQGDVFRHYIGTVTSDDNGLNPFRAGRCLSTFWHWLFKRYSRSQSLSSRAMSFDKKSASIFCTKRGLNLFRAGRCLSTLAENLSRSSLIGLNPFRAGRCLSTRRNVKNGQPSKSQSLSSRAMSFDVM